MKIISFLLAILGILILFQEPALFPRYFFFVGLMGISFVAGYLLIVYLDYHAVLVVGVVQKLILFLQPHSKLAFLLALSSGLFLVWYVNKILRVVLGKYYWWLVVGLVVVWALLDVHSGKSGQILVNKIAHEVIKIVFWPVLT